MYQPPHFREDRTEVQYALIRQYPLGLLVTAGQGGLMANLAPFLIDAAGPGPAVLRCHLARANPQWRELLGLEECMAVFHGPQAYVSPSWYPSKRETGKVVPTWNYAAVHVWGRPSVIEDEAWLREQVSELDGHCRRRAGHRLGLFPMLRRILSALSSKASLACRSRSHGLRASGRPARTGQPPTAPASRQACWRRETKRWPRS